MPINPEPEEVLGDPIPRDEPFVVPASPEQTFDSVWLRSINIFCPNTSEANGRKPFWQCVNEVPEVKDAMDAIIAAIPALRTWANTPPPEPDPPTE